MRTLFSLTTLFILPCFGTTSLALGLTCNYIVIVFPLSTRKNSIIWTRIEVQGTTILRGLA